MILFKGNILNSPVNEIICHQVNASGIATGGVAQAIFEQYPKAKFNYENLCYSKSKKSLLGTTDTFFDESGRIIVNIFGQLKYRKNMFDKRQYTDEDALELAFSSMCHKWFNENKKQLGFKKRNEVTFAFPWLFGSDRGGADFSIVYNLIEEYLGWANVHFYCLNKENFPEDISIYPNLRITQRRVNR